MIHSSLDISTVDLVIPEPISLINLNMSQYLKKKIEKMLCPNYYTMRYNYLKRKEMFPCLTRIEETKEVGFLWIPV